MEKKKKIITSDVPNCFRSKGFVFVGYFLVVWLVCLGLGPILKNFTRANSYIQCLHNVPGTLERTSQIRIHSVTVYKPLLISVPYLFSGSLCSIWKYLHFFYFSPEKDKENTLSSPKSTRVVYHYLPTSELRGAPRGLRDALVNYFSGITFLSP